MHCINSERDIANFTNLCAYHKPSKQSNKGRETDTLSYSWEHLPYL